MERLRQRFVSSVIAPELAASESERLKTAANGSGAEMLLLEGVGEV